MRDAHQAAKTSPCTDCGVPEKDRHQREIQTSGANKASAYDHTFQILKNYYLIAALAAWTFAKEIGEILCVAFVKDTKMASAAHDFEQVVRRPPVPSQGPLLRQLEVLCTCAWSRYQRALGTLPLS